MFLYISESFRSKSTICCLACSSFCCLAWISCPSCSSLFRLSLWNSFNRRALLLAFSNLAFNAVCCNCKSTIFCWYRSSSAETVSIDAEILETVSWASWTSADRSARTELYLVISASISLASPCSCSFSNVMISRWRSAFLSSSEARTSVFSASISVLTVLFFCSVNFWSWISSWRASDSNLLWSERAFSSFWSILTAWRPRALSSCFLTRMPFNLFLLPPTRKPCGEMTSPFLVTMVFDVPLRLYSWMASDMSSVKTTWPSKARTIASYPGFTVIWSNRSNPETGASVWKWSTGFTSESGMNPLRPALWACKKSMASRPASWSSIIIYWSASPKTASTAVSKPGLASMISAISPTIFLVTFEITAASSALRGFMIALTPSRYHSKSSAIFLRVFKLDLTVLRSSSSVRVSLTCWPRALFFCANCLPAAVRWTSEVSSRSVKCSSLMSSRAKAIACSKKSRKTVTRISEASMISPAK